MIAALLLSSSFIPVTLGTSFIDVPPNHQFYQFINHISSEGVASGSNGFFFPVNKISRAETVKMALIAANIPIAPTGTSPFSDVTPTHTLHDYVVVAAQIGVVSGFTDGTFRPDNSVTRGAVAKIIQLAFKYATDLSGAPRYTDVPSTHNFYTNIETLSVKGMFSGVTPGIFMPDGFMLRQEMAKVLSLALGGPSPDGGGEAVLYYVKEGFPTGWLNVVNTKPSRFSLDLIGLDHIRSAHYEGWLVDVDGATSTGKFNIDETGNITDPDGMRITNAFDIGEDVDTFDEFKLTIEPSNDTNSIPSGTDVLSGPINPGDSEIFLNFPTFFPGYDGKAAVSGSTNQEITYTINGLPNLFDVGFKYEGWIIKNDTAYSTGKFSSQGNLLTVTGGTFFEDIIANADEIKISIEPISDNSSRPFQMIGWKSRGDIFGPNGGGNGTTSTATYTDEVFDCLTTRQSSEWVLNRTVVERDDGNDIVVEAYAGADRVPDDSEISIIVKACELDGTPLYDLDLEMTQTSGPSGDITDPEEVDNNSGVYIGIWEPDFSSMGTSSDDVRVRIDSNDSGDHFPPIEVEFLAIRSDSIAAPDVLYWDVTWEEVTFDENESENVEHVVFLAFVLDSLGAASEDVKSDMDLMVLSGELGLVTTQEEGLGYYWPADIDDMFDDDVSSESTFENEMRIELMASSGVILLPMNSDEFQVDVTYIPED